MKEMFRVVERLARTEATVLVRGETGAGKELVARAIHDLSSRKSGPSTGLARGRARRARRPSPRRPP